MARADSTTQTAGASLPRPDLAFVRAIGRLEERGALLLAAGVVAVSAELLSFFVASSWTFELMSRFADLCPDPFALDTGVLAEHRLRILGPVIAWILGLQGKTAALIPALANIPLLAILYRFVRQRTDLVSAILATFLFALTHLTITSRTLLGYQDSLLFLGVLVAFASPRFAVGAAACFLAMYADQRAVLALPLVVAWRYLEDDDASRRLGRAAVLALKYGGVVALWASTAWALTAYLKLEASTVDRVGGHLVGDFLTGIKPGYLQLSYFMSFKAAWIFLPIGLVLIWERSRLAAATLTATVSLILGLSVLVVDVSRAATLCFPVLLIGVISLWRWRAQTCATVLAACLLVNLISPFYLGMSSGLWRIQYALPVELVLRAVGNPRPESGQRPEVRTQEVH